MSGAVVAAVAAALAALVSGPGSLLPPDASRHAADTDAGQDAFLRRYRVPLAALALIGCWTVLGGWFGAVAGGSAGFTAWRVLSRVESPALAQRRAILERDLPMAVHLLGASLSAGAAPATAVLDVAEAFPGPISDEFRRTHHRLSLGIDPVTAWRSLDGPLQPLGRTMVRAHESGASVRSSVERLAHDLRADARLRVERSARGVEVRASAPLGVCFLPAFVVLGVIPMVVGIFSTLSLFG